MTVDTKAYEVKVEPEFYPARRIMEILIIGVVVIIISVVIVKVWLPPRHTVGGGGLTSENDSIGNIEQTLILADHSTERKQAAARATLEHYSWVNRERGIVAIPIERAMELVASGRP